MSHTRIIIAGGGTGGHIFPAIAIANAIKAKDPQVEFLFIGANGKMEMEKVPQAGYRIEGLDIAGFNRSNLFKNISLPFKLIRSFFQVKAIMTRFSPDAVIGVGGYSTFPVLRYAQKKGIPTFIHEANSFAGKSNILLGSRAVKVFTGTAGMEKFFPAEKIMVTGNPVRRAISRSDLPREQAIASFGLSPDKTTILVMGGSLGARSINEVIAAHVHEFGTHNLQLIWQTGKNNADAYKKRGETFRNIWVDVFITDMDRAYAAADLVVSRAGAMSVAELCVVKKPVIFVPYPHAAEDHQTVNAMHLVKQDAALIVADKEANTALFPAILNLAMDRNKQMALKTAIAALAITNADEVIATEILNHIRA
jgi:UDP-N-acetylglucosamine--N-acetylmuramyl-(pentapeptide) pyrophosphoryl-undecaprenol N-acetylglucosamine transferase